MFFFWIRGKPHIPENTFYGPRVWVNPDCPRLLRGKLNMQCLNLGIAFGNPRPYRCTPPSGRILIMSLTVKGSVLFHSVQILFFGQ